MGELGASFQGLGVDGKSVVLGSDLDSLGAQVDHRMVRTVMAKVELVGLPAQGEAEDLMSEADTEDRFLSQHACDRLMGIRQRGWIARSIGKKNPVRVFRENLLRA